MGFKSMILWEIEIYPKSISFNISINIHKVLNILQFNETIINNPSLKPSK